MSPLCESYVSEDRLDQPEVFYPLHVRQCASCLLVQLPAYVSGEEIFSDYAYFSSYSDSWVAHAKRYAESMIDRLGLTSDSLVTEVASNDGYLLQHFLGSGHPGARGRAGDERGRSGPVAGDPDGGGVPRSRDGPARSPSAMVAPIWLLRTTSSPMFPTSATSRRASGALVKDTGLVTLEFPHLLRLMQRRQYDTIYHEHYSYLSLLTSSRALATAGLRVVDVDEIDTHGGSLRVYARPEENPGEPTATGEGGARRRGGAGLHTSERTCRIRDRGAEDQERPRRVSPRRGQGRTLRRRLRRARQGKHAAQPLRHSIGPPPVHR